jgi:Domain of unknown function (DUF4258)
MILRKGGMSDRRGSRSTNRRKRIHRRFKFSGHAHERCIERGIQRKDVLSVLRTPVQTIYDEYTERYKSFGNAIDAPKHLLVIHTGLKGKSSVTVITVMWTSKGGLRQHGFSNI